MTIKMSTNGTSGAAFFKKKRAWHLQESIQSVSQKMLQVLVDKNVVFTHKNFLASIRGLHEQVNTYDTVSSYDDAHQTFTLRAQPLRNVHERLAISRENTAFSPVHAQSISKSYNVRASLLLQPRNTVPEFQESTLLQAIHRPAPLTLSLNHIVLNHGV